jgi:hypothetical protein
VTCSLNETGKLIIYNCDIGDPVQQFYGDSGIEVTLTLEKENTEQLKTLLRATDVLQSLKERFTGEGCFAEIRQFMEEHTIKFNFDIWR